jgi:hypothetical protein
MPVKPRGFYTGGRVRIILSPEPSIPDKWPFWEKKRPLNPEASELKDEL